MIYRVKQKNNPAEFSDTCSVRGEGRAVHWLPMSVGRERAGKKIKHAGFFFAIPCIKSYAIVIQFFQCDCPSSPIQHKLYLEDR